MRKDMRVIHFSVIRSVSRRTWSRGAGAHILPTGPAPHRGLGPHCGVARTAIDRPSISRLERHAGDRPAGRAFDFKARATRLTLGAIAIAVAVAIPGRLLLGPGFSAAVHSFVDGSHCPMPRPSPGPARVGLRHGGIAAIPIGRHTACYGVGFGGLSLPGRPRRPDLPGCPGTCGSGHLRLRADILSHADAFKVYRSARQQLPCQRARAILRPRPRSSCRHLAPSSGRAG